MVYGIVSTDTQVIKNPATPNPSLESREPRNIVLSKFRSRIDRKFDVCLIACVAGSLDHILYL